MDFRFLQNKTIYHVRTEMRQSLTKEIKSGKRIIFLKGTYKISKALERTMGQNCNWWNVEIYCLPNGILFVNGISDC